jgi:trehalose synthase
MLKARPVIGGDVGGITLQIRHGVNGFLVRSVAGAAHRIRYLLHRRQEARRMGEAGREVAIAEFLLTRHLRDYLLLLIALRAGDRRHVKLTFDGEFVAYP